MNCTSKPSSHNEPEAGKIYVCKTIHDPVRICRFGYHRKNNHSNWNDPPEWKERKLGPSIVWYGWRDHHSFRFLRPEEIVDFKELRSREDYPEYAKLVDESKNERDFFEKYKKEFIVFVHFTFCKELYNLLKRSQIDGVVETNQGTIEEVC